MDEKYYLDEQGVINLLSSISKKIKDKTSNEIEVNEDPETGEKTTTNPNNFSTTGSVVNYLRNRSKIKFNQQSTSESDDDYSVLNNISEYNGEDEVQIQMKLANANDIRNLFNN